jgi:hypothetical protein
LFSKGREAKQVVAEQHDYCLNLKEEATELVFEYYELLSVLRKAKQKGTERVNLSFELEQIRLLQSGNLVFLTWREAKRGVATLFRLQEGSKKLQRRETCFQSEANGRKTLRSSR